MHTKRTKTIALFGYGYWGEKIAAVLEESFQVVVIDPYKKNIPSRFSTSSLADILNNQDITMGVIATPEETHFELAKKLLEAKKHVWVEKPLCLQATQARELFAVAATHHLTLFVDTIFYFDPLAQVVHDWVSSLAEPIQSITSERYSNKKPRPAITVSDDLAIHDIYLLRWWLNNPQLDITKVTQNKSTALVQMQATTPSGQSVPIELKYALEVTSPSRKLNIKTKTSSLSWTKSKTLEKVVIQSLISKETFRQVKPQALNTAVEVFVKLCTQARTSRTSQLEFHSPQNIVADIELLELIK